MSTNKRKGERLNPWKQMDLCVSLINHSQSNAKQIQISTKRINNINITHTLTNLNIPQPQPSPTTLRHIHPIPTTTRCCHGTSLGITRMMARQACRGAMRSGLASRARWFQVVPGSSNSWSMPGQRLRARGWQGGGEIWWVWLVFLMVEGWIDDGFMMVDGGSGF